MFEIFNATFHLHLKMVQGRGLVLFESSLTFPVKRRPVLQISFRSLCLLIWIDIDVLISINPNIQVLYAGISQAMDLDIRLQMESLTPFAGHSQISYQEISFLVARRSQRTSTYTFLGL